MEHEEFLRITAGFLFQHSAVRTGFGMEEKALYTARIKKALSLEKRVRRRANPQIGFQFPVLEIVPAGIPGACEIGDFVLGKALLCHDLTDR